LDRPLSPSAQAIPDAGGSAPEATDAVLAQAAQVAIIGIFVLLLIGCLDLARTFLLPTVSAIVFGVMLGPVSVWASQYRIPSWLFALVAVGLLFAGLNLAIVLLSAPVIDWIGRAPEIGAAMAGKLQLLERPLDAFRDLQKAISPGAEPGFTLGMTAIIQPVLGFLTPALGELLVFFAMLFFFLVGRDQMRRRLVLGFATQDRRLRMLRIINEVEQDLTRYLGAVTAVNAGVGVAAALLAYLVGYSNVLLWGVLAFVLNYIPYLGPAVMVLGLFGAGLAEFPTLAGALMAPGLFIAMATIEGHFVTPGVIGRNLTVDPLAVFLSLAFWTWLWGPVGALLATPLLIAGYVAWRHSAPRDDVELPG
jgi:predicted PurR-regulated permease PerM